MDRKLLFLAILLPPDLAGEVTRWKEHARDAHGSAAAMKSPPHITLVPPFHLAQETVPALAEAMTEFAARTVPVPVELSDFSSFPPLVVFVDVVQTPELKALETDLVAHLRARLGSGAPVPGGRNRERGFRPHVTIATRDLTREAFRELWHELRDVPFQGEFRAQELALLEHDGSRWQVRQRFCCPLTGSDES